MNNIFLQQEYTHPRRNSVFEIDDDEDEANTQLDESNVESFTIETAESLFRIPATCSQISQTGPQRFSDLHISVRKEKTHQLLHLSMNMDTFPTYSLITKRKYRETGKTAVYIFTDQSNKILYEAKQNRKHPNVFNVYTPGSTDAVAALIMAENNADFSFRKFNQRGPELVKIQFSAAPVHTFRNATVTFMYASTDKKPQRLRSREPPLDTENKPIYNFDNKPFIESIRNLIFYSRHQDKNYIAVRKTAENELQIDTMFHSNILWLVAICLSDAISPVC